MKYLKIISAYVLWMTLALSCSSSKFKPSWTKTQAPDTFTAKFQTSKGDFNVVAQRQLSPKAVDRFYQLVKTRYFDNILFYRVNPGFVAQFGAHDSTIYQAWNQYKIPDEPVLQGNEKGTLSFARGGKESRGTDLFINLRDNHRLDTLDYNGVKGFPTFGRVTEGMDVLESLYDGYADTTMNNLDVMYTHLDAFIKKYPKLDTIYGVALVK
ncbi:Peptidyl-prolyl cis-trans isomerase A [Croceitalea dokdonensis DOKDO 023]|uniref:peptidylprolyl isomerase n=1 Tax=Croceitalea dokdonensis DOKDO 023 TaxID=1300341 RepID=A0A0P7AX05_9FLAO|nr:peptidylprolyl isomerase [Croceitalea dokdonensis]KPM32565.1 Peptidyl-prolyl cis-trans isomerase A [Croceitalea dokdonensis DOKDO 023]